MISRTWNWQAAAVAACLVAGGTTLGVRSEPTLPAVEAQPLTAQVTRLAQALDYLGAPLAASDQRDLARAAAETNDANRSRRLQTVLDKYCLLEVEHQPREPRPRRRRPRAAPSWWSRAGARSS